MIFDMLKKAALKKAAGRTAASVRIGICYTAVMLDNGSTGLAYTFRHDIPHGCASFQGNVPLEGKSAEELLDFLDSSDLIIRTVGVAAMNALLNTENKELIKADVLELLKPGKDDVVGMVGYFGPLVAPLKKAAGELKIFEKEGEKALDIYPEEKAFELLPLCSKVIITSTSLINLTLEKLLETTRNCEKTALVGSTTPLVVNEFRELGVDLLSGVIVKDPKAILRVVSEGGGVRLFRNYVEKVNAVCTA